MLLNTQTKSSKNVTTGILKCLQKKKMQSISDSVSVDNRMSQMWDKLRVVYLLTKLLQTVIISFIVQIVTLKQM